jgi:hypothetical protein
MPESNCVPPITPLGSVGNAMTFPSCYLRPIREFRCRHARHEADDPAARRGGDPSAHAVGDA